MKAVEFNEVCLGDTIMVLENLGGCITTAHGLVTRLSRFNEIDLNTGLGEGLGLEIFEDTLIVLVNRNDNATAK